MTPWREGQHKQAKFLSRTHNYKKERYDLLFVVRDINFMCLDTTIANYVEFLITKMRSSWFVNCLLQTKQTTRNNVHHDKKGQAPGQSQAQQMQDVQPSKARRRFTTDPLHLSKSQVQ